MISIFINVGARGWNSEKLVSAWATGAIPLLKQGFCVGTPECSQLWRFGIQSCRKRISLMLLLQAVGAQSLPPKARDLKLSHQAFPPPLVWLCVLLESPGFTMVCSSVN